MDANQLKELTEYFDSRYVQKDTCSDRHEKQDSKMTELSINQAKMQTTLSTITKKSLYSTVRHYKGYTQLLKPFNCKEA